jgi:hypothetical protein
MKNIAVDSKLDLSPFHVSQAGNLGDERPEDMGGIFEKLQMKRMPRLTWNVVYSVGVKK